LWRERTSQISRERWKFMIATGADDMSMASLNPQYAGEQPKEASVETETLGDHKVNVPVSDVFPPQPRSKNLQKGFLASLRKFGRQTLALTSKNLKLSLRNSSATIAQLWIGVLFLILLLIIGAALAASSRSDTSFVDTKTQVDRNAPTSFPPCSVGPGKSACYAFAYGSTRDAPFRNDSDVEELIDRVAAILQINPDRNASGGIYSLGAANASVIEQWILDNPNTTRAVLMFENSHQWKTMPTSAFRYIYRFNSTRNCREIRIYKCDEPWLDYHLPLVSAVNAAFNSLYGGDANTKLSVSFSNFPHPDLPSAFDAMKSFGALFIYIALTFNYVILLTTIVREKELHLVESMRQMGMMNSAYWVSWILSGTIINTLMVFLLMLFGVILQFELFLETDGQLLLTILWMSAQAFTAIALFFSSFIRTTSTARVIGVMVFIVTFIAAPLLYQAYYQDPTETYNTARWAIAIFPFFSFYHSLQTVIDSSSGSLQTGMKWEDRMENLLPPSATNLNPTFWSLNSSLSWLAVSFFIFVGLAWYIEQIVPNEFGRSKYPWFIFDPRYWGFGCSRKAKVKQPRDEAPPTFDDHTDPDVKEEALAIYNNAVSPPPAVVLKGVKKTFGRFERFVAVNRVFYGMHYGQLTAILGHNGSGKSTTFNMLTGLMNVSDGDAEIFGRSVRGDMAELHASMGVCPQHDVLWDQLTAREHLELFARIKGLEGDVKDEGKRRIDQVKLQSAADSRVGKFSGGMRRRLSIAIAMLGDPAIVFLDEPVSDRERMRVHRDLRILTND
jgi:ABC-type Na+ transport system ATPase subunit NatA